MKANSILISLSLIVFVFQFTFSRAQSGLVINEFMADNDAFIADSTDGKYEDWIEIYNGSVLPIPLGGCHLTDNRSLPLKWAFPHVILSPDEFLLVWADGDSGDAGLHTNFKLSKSGEFLGLYSNSGEDVLAIDTLTYGAQHTDVSCGRIPDGGAAWQTLAAPTPGVPNSATAVADSSDVLFDDTCVHTYELHFYIENWADSLEYYYAHGEEYLPARLTYAGRVLDSIGVRYKGNSSYMISRKTPKKPFKFKLNSYRKGQTLFDVRMLNFSNCVKDPSFMREKIGYDIARKYLPAPRATYADIWVDGVLIGFYVQVEQVDKTFLARHFESTDGNLYKASDNGTALTYLGTDQSRYTVGLELKTNENENDWSALITMLDHLSNAPAADFQATLENELNLDVCCRMLALNMVLSNFDSYTGSGRNFYLYDNSAAGQFQMIPWDFNETFGAFTNNWNVITVNVVNVPNLSQRPLNRRILENESLRQAYLRYIEDMISGPAAYDSVLASTARLKLLIDAHVQADANKLYSYDKFLANIQKDVAIDMGVAVPGILSFSTKRNANLQTQLAQYINTSVESGATEVRSFELHPSYPNPFNAVTKIRFSLSEESRVRLEVINVLGARVALLVDERRSAGTYSVTFDAARLPSGFYVSRLCAGDQVQMRKLLVLK